MFEPIYLLLIGSGALAGFLAGLMGIGGGIVTVPIMYFSMGFLGIEEAVRMHTAVATSLLIIIPTSVRSARAHFRNGAIDVAIVQRWAPMIVVGAVAGRLIAGKLSDQQMVLAFAVVVVLMSLRFFYISMKGQLKQGDYRKPGVFSQLIALFIGGVSSLMGIGGATFSVPVISGLGRSIHKAVGTASMLGLLISIPAVIFTMVEGNTHGAEISSHDWQYGYFNLLLFAFVAPLSIYFAPIGARVAHRISAEKLSLFFGVFLLLTAIRMAWPYL